MGPDDEIKFVIASRGYEFARDFTAQQDLYNACGRYCSHLRFQTRPEHGRV